MLPGPHTTVGHPAFWKIPASVPYETTCVSLSPVSERAKDLESFVLDLEPMIGCFGVAPASGPALANATSAENGGKPLWRRNYGLVPRGG
jgi:amidase